MGKPKSLCLFIWGTVGHKREDEQEATLVMKDKRQHRGQKDEDLIIISAAVW